MVFSPNSCGDFFKNLSSDIHRGKRKKEKYFKDDFIGETYRLTFICFHVCSELNEESGQLLLISIEIDKGEEYRVIKYR